MGILVPVRRRVLGNIGQDLSLIKRLLLYNFPFLHFSIYFESFTHLLNIFSKQFPPSVKLSARLKEISSINLQRMKYRLMRKRHASELIMSFESLHNLLAKCLGLSECLVITWFEWKGEFKHSKQGTICRSRVIPYHRSNETNFNNRVPQISTVELMVFGRMNVISWFSPCREFKLLSVCYQLSWKIRSDVLR